MKLTAEQANLGMAIINGFQSGAQALAENSALESEANLADHNAYYAQLEYEKAFERGELATTRLTDAYVKFKKDQKAKVARAGIDVTSGSAAAIADQSKKNFEEDVLQIRSNAFAEATGYKRIQTSLDIKSKKLREAKSSALDIVGTMAVTTLSSFLKGQVSSGAFKGAG